MRAENREANQARADVRETVGDVLACDTAEEIYGFALDHMKVDREGITGTKALRAIYLAHAGRNAPRDDESAHHIAMDAASNVLTLVPSLSRIKRA